MDNKEMFQSVIYKAAADGVAKLIRGGMTITVLLGVVAGLVWALIFQHNQHMQDRAELRAQLEVVRKEVSDCNKARSEDSARIARLETIIEQNQNK